MAFSQIPKPSEPLVSPQTGLVTVPWFQFFLRLIAQLLPEGVAPGTAEYIVAAPHSALPNARVATSSPTVTVDVSVPGIIRWHAAGGSGPALPSATGGYALTGSAALLAHARAPIDLPTDAGTYALTGSDAGLTRASAPTLLPTTAGAYALTGSDAAGGAVPAGDLYVAQVALEVAYNVSPVLYTSQVAVETMIQPSVQTVTVAQVAIEVMIA